MNLFDLMAKITLDSSEYEKGLDDSEKKAGSFGSNLKKGLGTAAKIGGAAIGTIAAGTAALGTAMVKGAGDVASYGDNIDKMSQKMGISATAYQEWDAILQHSGTSIDGMQRAMLTLSNAAEQGSDAFEKLGLTQEQVASMNQEELFAATITGLQNMEAGTERTALAQKLLGGAVKELGPLLNTSAEETEAMRQRVHELGGVMSDEAVKASAAYQDSLQDMSTSLDGLKRGIFSEFMPGITGVMNGLTSIFSGESGSGVDMITSGISDMIQRISDGLPKVVEIGGQIVSGLITAITSNLPQIVQQGAAIIVELVTGIVKQLPEIVKSGLDIILTLADSLSDALPDLIPVVMQVIITIVQTLLNPQNIGKLLKAAVEIVLALGKGILGALAEVLKWASAIVQKLGEGISKGFNTIKNAGKKLVTNMIDGIKTTFSNLVQTGKNVIDNIKNGISSAFEVMKAWITEKFNSIKEKLTGPFETAKETIKNIIDKIKGFFHFEWSLPHLKLPHFSISPSGWKIGDLLKGSIPHLSIEWYAKAYENPYMFSSPTVVPTAAGLKGFGDRAGGEMVYGHENLMRDIRAAVAAEMPKTIKLYLDGDKLVGGTSSRMNSKLGQMQQYQLRWEGAK